MSSLLSPIPLAADLSNPFPRPGGNSTGFTNFEPTIGGKWLELLKEIAPAMERLAMVLNPETVPGGINGVQLRAGESAAVAFGTTLRMMPFRSAAEIESGFDTVERDRIDGLVVLPDTLVTHNTPPPLAAKQATSVIPIVFATAGDPVGTGIVASLARPGGNVTGLSSQSPDAAGKRLELLRQLVPGLRRLAVLSDIGNPFTEREKGEVQRAARTLGLELATADIRRAEDIDSAFQGLQLHAQALYVPAVPLFFANRARITNLAPAVRLPTMHLVREYVEAGGLMCYGPNWPDMWRQAADLVDKILRGAKPADIPVQQPTKFDLVVNLRTAKALGLNIPDKLLALADEVIE
jgi:putative tryptophan/tyrosine transport system substrate-binding protein